MDLIVIKHLYNSHNTMYILNTFITTVHSFNLIVLELWAEFLTGTCYLIRWTPSISDLNNNSAEGKVATAKYFSLDYTTDYVQKRKT